ncbi:chondroitin AC/alginate lyase, partial [Auricularia subglabra TFB-10046 SS5]
WTLCPYIRRDGVANPDVRLLPDSGWFVAMSDAAHLAAIAGASGKYAQGFTDATRFIRAWFTSNTTGVNPNLNFGQLIRGPGIEVGTYTGVLDFRFTTKIANAVAIMRAANATEWTAADDAAMNTWATQYINWLTTNALGLQSFRATNNHGTFYVNQLAALRIMVGDTQGAINALNGYFKGIYLNQILSSGEQPLESIRTQPNHYQAFNIEAMIVNARLGDQLGLNFWSAKTRYGATIQTAVNYLMPRAGNTDDLQMGELAPHVATVAAAYGDPQGKYAKFLNNAYGSGYTGQRWWYFDQTAALPNSPLAQAIASSISASLASSTSTTSSSALPTNGTTTDSGDVGSTTTSSDSGDIGSSTESFTTDSATDSVSDNSTVYTTSTDFSDTGSTDAPTTTASVPSDSTSSDAMPTTP